MTDSKSPNETLGQIVYVSRETIEFNEPRLIGLLNNVRRLNEAKQITGMLVYDKGHFLQVIEGDLKTLDRVFGYIAVDKRHTEVTKLVRQPVSQRFFPNWSMGFSNLSDSKHNQVEGLNDFFQQGKCIEHINHRSRALKILKGFASGSWHE